MELAAIVNAREAQAEVEVSHVVVVGIITVGGLWPITELGSEFMPELDEGGLMYMPTAVPAVSAGQTQEVLERAAARLRVVVPMTLAIIVLLLYVYFRNLAEVAILMASLSFALIGGIWLLYLLDYHLSVATGVGFIARKPRKKAHVPGRPRRCCARPAARCNCSSGSP